MTEEIEFVPAEVAKKVVSEIVDEEHLHDPDRRILTVYDIQGKEICWFDTEEIMAEIGMKADSEKGKEAAVEYIFNHIPVWAVESVLKNLKNK